MNISQLKSQFSAMGARFTSQVVESHRWVGNDYVIDIQRDRHGPFFELRLFRSLESRLDVNVLQVRPRERHLLLLVRRDKPEHTLDRFLCGHDEREWFVAAVPGRVSSVAQAMESLKPEPVLAAQAQAGLTARQRHSRNNRAFRRQGEWFFVPLPGLNPALKRILRDEPIRRGLHPPSPPERRQRAEILARAASTRRKSDSSGHCSSVNAKSIEQSGLQPEPSRCESGHGRQIAHSCSPGVRVLHLSVRRRGFVVQVHVGAPV